ncbi:MAG: UDP-N-acetylmuramoyl-L-alanine--D-glutamate ligase [Phycisphaerales bacterium]|nr:UDP-N-acetylmuramoyl-L-alanine--D-glutamate ligase [Phycisphaerales bacterium]MCB9836799.1 UDP-N-acetylmuramoyl-L-alanine--D-glutamate ligase [Phycisphaera sp.]
MDERRATVMGLGSFGGGAGAVRHLCALGCDVLVTDMAPAEKLTSSLEAIRDLVDSGAVTLRLGEHNVSDFTTCDLLVANPAVKLPWENRFVRAAQAAGVRVTTEIGLVIDALPESCKVVAVTGSSGKSTTSAMIHAGLKSAGVNALLGGNIGGSLLGQDITENATVVLELSSAMLWWLAQPGCTERTRFLDVALITNITPNHVDWHGSVEHYTQSKLNIAQMLKDSGMLLVGPNVDTDHERAQRLELITSLPELATPGAHNRVNASAALAACEALGVDRERTLASIAEFAGLPHRLELVRTHKGVRWYNDSKSTTPEATRLALEALRPARVHLIVGGSDKGVDLAPIADLVRQSAALYCIGQTGETIARLAGIEPVGTLSEAVRLAASNAKEGEAVVLSPGCASFDQFRSFEDRGNQFRDLVHSL